MSESNSSSLEPTTIPTTQQRASQYAGIVVWLWIITIIITDLVLGNLFSWDTVLLIIPGIFVISIFSIPFFLLSNLKIRVLTSVRFNSRSSIGQVPGLIFFTLTTFLQYIFPVAAAIFTANLLNSF